MEISIEATDCETVVRPRGEVDLASSPELAGCLEELGGHVVVHLGGVTFLDSSGMSVLIGARRHLRARGGDLWLRAPDPFVLRTLQLTGLESLVEDPHGADAP